LNYRSAFFSILMTCCPLKDGSASGGNYRSRITGDTCYFVLCMVLCSVCPAVGALAARLIFFLLRFFLATRRRCASFWLFFFLIPIYVHSLKFLFHRKPTFIMHVWDYEKEPICKVAST